MEGILKFNLPEEESEFRLATGARDLYCALWEIDRFLRGEIKHGDISDEICEAYEKLRELLHEQVDMERYE